MSKYVIEDTTLSAIADAVREKAGTTEKIVVSELPDAIAAIPTGASSGDGTHGNHYLLLNATKSGTSGSLDLSDYISDLSQIQSIFVCGSFTGSGNDGAAYWHRGLSPEGYADTFRGTTPSAFTIDGTYPLQWTTIDGDTASNQLTWLIANSTRFLKFIIRYTEV